jgi:uncharacterized membrane protein
MKKYKFLAIIITVALIAGVSIFFACEKEEKDISASDISKAMSVATDNNLKDYEEYVDELVEETGVDVRILSQKDYLQNFHLLSQSIGTEIFFSPDLNQNHLDSLFNLVLQAANNADMNELSFHYISMLNYLTNNEIPVHLEMDNLLSLVPELVETIGMIDVDFKNFRNLSEEKAVEVLSVAHTYPALSYAPYVGDIDCLQNYRNDISANILIFEGSMALCVLGAGIPVLAGVCVAVAVATLVYSNHQAQKTYEFCKQAYNQ